MKLSIICCLNNTSSENVKSIETLIKEIKKTKSEVQLIVSSPDAKYDDVKLLFSSLPATTTIDLIDKTFSNVAECYNNALAQVEGDYVTAFFGGDSYTNGALKKVCKTIEDDGKEIYVIPKLNMSGNACNFRSPIALNPDVKRYKDNINKTYKAFPKLIEFSVDEYYECYPFGFGGTFIQTKLIKDKVFSTTLPWDFERDVFLRILIDHKKVSFINKCANYISWEYEESNIAFYRGLYELSWYYDSFDDFWVPFFDELKATLGSIPKFIQYHFMYALEARISGNLNNRNKHIIEEDKGEEYLRYLCKHLDYIDEDALFNKEFLKECDAPGGLFWVFGILKYGEDFKFETFKDDRFESTVCGAFGVTIAELYKYSVDIQFMEYENGKLEIDGRIHPILFSIADDFKIRIDGKDYPLEYCERYGLTKAFGKAIFKLSSFHVSVPVSQDKKTSFEFNAIIGKKRERCKISFESHFSRLSKRFNNSYWCFGEKERFMATYKSDVITIDIVNGAKRFGKEFKLQMNMLACHSLWIEKYAIFRILYFMLRPIMTKKPIWMYIDKIYKGGDSSEYLYQYASKRDNSINHYYLIDKNSSDYKRLKNLGFKPLKRNSLMQKLIFMYADMMIISNSTVYAFNGYGIASSALIRGLPHFHVCCVQHGMSVQKIAIAQNRLRDNTRLYFCASQYEIDNLSRPVYDYIGYDALKLTGVPRYDGLHDRASKQIMISPTWRMQAAAPVRTNEGEQRDYNPLFRESTYYRVFNSLINDPRLIDAAREYGYRIKYVLHPIVSSQVEDFDKNDFVDIVPAVGDMSYEDMFCESSLMVTDFSGIQFDFAYMRKPVVYLHHKDIPQHYEEGTFYYDTMAFGEICHDNDELINLLIDYMKNGCQMKEEYRRRADDFFYYDDDKNCERIYDVMKKYQLEKLGR